MANLGAAFAERECQILVGRKKGKGFEFRVFRKLALKCTPKCNEHCAAVTTQERWKVTLRSHLNGFGVGLEGPEIARQYPCGETCPPELR